MITRSGRAWAIGFAVAFVYTGAQTFQLAAALPRIPWLELFLFELPVWCTIVALSPVIFYFARRLPLLGAHPLRNSIAHLAPAALVLLTMFFIVELSRQVVVYPIVNFLDIAKTKEAIEYREFAKTISLFHRATSGFRTYWLFFLFCYYAGVVLHQAIASYRAMVASQLHARELETLLARSQLDSLKLQLQPHFLFNTLNTVSSLMSRDILLARRTLARLSDLLRRSLRDSSRHEIPLKGELEFLDAYMEIQQARFGTRLIVARDVDPLSMTAMIPRMLLQPLVENSIRHGMRDGADALVVHVRIARKDDVLRLSVYDNGRGIPADGFEEGLGLTNTRERLDRLYPDQYDLTIHEPPGGGFEVVISIPARDSDEVIMTEDARDIA
ncbi:MAG TPA: histidine kinase [Gemmatimonadaceae bacterium]|nr:histidine kinase [Gemmatimonadaceae bacterium]